VVVGVGVGVFFVVVLLGVFVVVVGVGVFLAFGGEFGGDWGVVAGFSVFVGGVGGGEVSFVGIAEMRGVVVVDVGKALP
jgi:hypothetical protein